jgi:hypothetical protein
MKTALRYGVCAAAACLCGVGCSDGLRPMAECLELEQTFGVKISLNGDINSK